MIGTFINLGALLVGGIFALVSRREVSTGNQNLLKVLLGVLTLVFGIMSLWSHLNGGIWQVLLQFLLLMVAMSLGKILGGKLKLQKGLTRLARYAQDLFTRTASPSPPAQNQGLLVCSILFCTGPLAITGALMDGAFGDYKLLLVKSVMDGLAIMTFARVFGGSVLLSAIPLLAYQGSLTILGYLAATHIPDAMAVETLGAVGGMMMLSIGLVILEARKIELADYLPAFILAPLLIALVL